MDQDEYFSNWPGNRPKLPALVPDHVDKWYGTPPVTTTDPSDAAMNRPLKVSGVTIWDKNPCALYNQGSDSPRNSDRREGCARAAGHLWDAGFQKGSSDICPDIQGAECFQFVNHSKPGRCYGKVRYFNGARGYVLLYTCAQDWARVQATRFRNPYGYSPQGQRPFGQGETGAATNPG
nr:PREDICTED: uncharacterized protein LOC109029921 [Bemisia tabaci]